jgi:hypothetical protein
MLFEVTLMDEGIEVGTFDLPQPAVGTDYGDCVVVEVLAFDAEAMTATVGIEYC